VDVNQLVIPAVAASDPVKEALRAVGLVAAVAEIFVVFVRVELAFAEVDWFI